MLVNTRLIFQKMQNDISLQRNNEYIGKKVNVMVESLGDNDFKCRAVTNHIVHVKSNKMLNVHDQSKMNLT